jgi:DNA-binding CsgD family transcriptional regulator
VEGVAVKFTPQQYRVFQMLTSTLSNKEIAAELGISTRGAKNHVTMVYAKTGVSGRVEFWEKFGFHPKGKQE